MTYVLAVAVALGYGVWFLALVREERRRREVRAFALALDALLPAVRQAARDIARVGLAFRQFGEAVREAQAVIAKTHPEMREAIERAGRLGGARRS